MNLEKLKPWNWFKHEEESKEQIPVVNKDQRLNSDGALSPLQPNSTVGSLLQMHQQMDRLFDNLWRSFGFDDRAGLLSPSALSDRWLQSQSMAQDFKASLDISGDDKEYEIKIDLPGLSKEDIQIEVQDHTLRIFGEKEEKNENKDKHFYRVERQYGAFQRTLSLPDDADANEISASMKNGVLTLQIPRKAIARDDVKRIEISA